VAALAHSYELQQRSSRTVAEFDRRLDRKPRWNAIETATVDDVCHGTFFISKVGRSALLTGEAGYCLTKSPHCVKPAWLRPPSERTEGRHGVILTNEWGHEVTQTPTPLEASA
jgi:hypothetical protein